MTSVLNEALGVVTGPRQEAYGDPVVTCERIGRVWSGILGLDYDLPAATVSALMVGLKMVRETSGEGSRDNWVDAAGYAHIGALAREDAIPFDEPLPKGRTLWEGSDLSSEGPEGRTVFEGADLKDPCGPCGCAERCPDLEAEDVRLRAERAAWEERTKLSLTPFSRAAGSGLWPPSNIGEAVDEMLGRKRSALHLVDTSEADAALLRLRGDVEREEKLRLAKHFSQGIRPTRLRVER